VGGQARQAVCPAWPIRLGRHMNVRRHIGIWSHCAASTELRSLLAMSGLPLRFYQAPERALKAASSLHCKMLIVSSANPASAVPSTTYTRNTTRPQGRTRTPPQHRTPGNQLPNRHQHHQHHHEECQSQTRFQARNLTYTLCRFRSATRCRLRDEQVSRTSLSQSLGLFRMVVHSGSTPGMAPEL
jgi:hypothetical protein